LHERRILLLPGEKSRPDITAFGTSDVETIQQLEASNFIHLYAHAALIVERKLSTEDPFESLQGEFEKGAVFAKRIRGQLITYAKHHHDAQPRVFSFHLFCLARRPVLFAGIAPVLLLPHDLDGPAALLLSDFLARFDAASPKQRGVDTTSRPASPEESPTQELRSSALVSTKLTP